MELLSFNSTFVRLSSTPPTVGSTLTAFNTLNTIQGATTVYVDYNLLNFNVKAFKTIINWVQDPYGDIADSKQVFNCNLNPAYTLTPNNSATSKHIFTPTTDFQVITSNLMMYYENGVVHSFNMVFYLVPDNIIDGDLVIVDSQIVDTTTNVFNIESQRNNVLYPVTS